MAAGNFRLGNFTLDQFAININPVMLVLVAATAVLTALVTALICRNNRQKLLAEAAQQKTVIEFQVQVAEKEQRRLQELLSITLQQQHETEQQCIERGERLIVLRAELNHQQQQAEDKIQLLLDAKKQLAQEFEVLANRIFEEKTERFSKNSKTTLDVAINPLREQLKEFKQKVEDVYDKDSKERVSLVEQINQLKQLNIQMSDDTNNLANALKGDNKVQGNWGEVILERVLEESGLHKGREYDTQVSLKTEDGSRRNPDVIVRLPENKDIIIDAKVSLVHYERYCNSTDENDRGAALKEHIASVRAHINGLSVKDYENLEGIRTLDFVFIFIPVEAAFMAAFEHDQAMFRDAYEKNIIVVGPTTLLATLRTVQSIWRYERQNKNAEEIARQAGAMHDKFVRFIADLDDVGSHLQRAEKAHAEALRKLSTGPGNLVNSTQKLEKLGAKVKKQLPSALKEMAQESDLSLVDDSDSITESH